MDGKPFKLFTVFLSFLIFSNVHSFVSRTVPIGIGTNGNTLTFSYAYNDTNIANNTIITMNIQIDCGECWVGIGWQGNSTTKGMTYTDFVVAIWDANGNPSVIDRYLGYVDPTQDPGGEPLPDVAQNSTNDITATSAFQIGKYSSFTFTRLLTTNDTKTDIPIRVDGSTRFLFAYGTSNVFDYHAQNRIVIDLTLSTGDFSIYDIKELLYVAHGALMVFSFGICMTFGIFVARYLRHRVQFWFPLHVFIQTIAIIAACCAFGIGIYLVHDHFATLHGKFGYFIVTASILTGALGIIADRMYVENRTKTPFFPDKLHWWVSRIVVLLAYVNIILGILDFWGYNPSFIYVFAIYLVLIAVTTLFMEWQIYQTPTQNEGYAPINDKMK